MSKKEVPSKFDVGDKAPAFKLESDSGETVKLSDFKDQNIVLYFYPKDDTPGCTKQACTFNDDKKLYAKHGAIVIGISPDSVKRHEKFKTKYKLGFPLLSDEDHAVCELYGVWVEKSMYGRKYMGVQRTTFLIDKKGKIAGIWPKVKVEGHSDEVLEALKELK